MHKAYYSLFIASLLLMYPFLTNGQYSSADSSINTIMNTNKVMGMSVAVVKKSNCVRTVFWFKESINTNTTQQF